MLINDYCLVLYVGIDAILLFVSNKALTLSRSSFCIFIFACHTWPIYMLINNKLFFPITFPVVYYCLPKMVKVGCQTVVTIIFILRSITVTYNINGFQAISFYWAGLSFPEYYMWMYIDGAPREAH